VDIAILLSSISRHVSLLKILELSIKKNGEA